MRRIVLLGCLLVVVVFSTGLVLAQNVVIDPAKGQTPDQMEKDKFECYTWTKEQTGFDPMQGQPTAPPPPQAPKGGVVKGAAKGAAVGAVVGEIANDDAGKGAAAGAAGGAMVGGMKKRGAQQQQAQAQQQQSAAVAQKQNDYNRAFGACLEGRGYSVK